MKNKSIFESFNNAILGIVKAIKSERNLQIQLFFAVLALLASLFFDLETTELVILIFTIVLVIVTELINTAIEASLDAVFGKKMNATVRKAKDVAAGAVFITAMNAVFVAYVLFYSKLTRYNINVFSKIRRLPVYITLISVVLILIFTIVIKTLTSHNKMLRGGMPSGHSAIAFGLATAISFLSESMDNNILLVTLAYFLALLVAQSRVEGKIHSQIEVLAGAILGILSVILIFSIFG